MCKILLKTNLTLLLCLMATAVWAQNIIYVKQDAAGAADGSSWTNAFTGLQAAIDAADSPADQIWVAAGTYLPTKTTVSENDRYKTFELNKALNILGGFEGNELPGFNLDDRDIVFNETILSGNLGVPGNAYHVLSAVSATGTITLDGFTISGGNANFTDTPADATATDGGGLYVRASTVVLKNNFFKNNFANRRGGAIYADAVGTISAVLSITKCSFEGNRAYEGGAIQLIGIASVGGTGGVTSSATINDCSFIGNFAETRVGTGTSAQGGALRAVTGVQINITNTCLKVTRS